MSARRFGFESFFEPLYSVERLRTSFLQGTGAGIGLFTREILPLVTALRASDRFAAAAIIRRTSPLLERKALEEAGDKQSDILSKAKAACDGLLALVSADEKPSARAVLGYARGTLGLGELCAIVTPSNARSIALLHKLGFCANGTVCLPGKDETVDAGVRRVL